VQRIQVALHVGFTMQLCRITGAITCFITEKLIVLINSNEWGHTSLGYPSSNYRRQSVKIDDVTLANDVNNQILSRTTGRNSA
jgi:hypothetical protein